MENRFTGYQKTSSGLTVFFGFLCFLALGAALVAHTCPRGRFVVLGTHIFTFSLRLVCSAFKICIVVQPAI